MDVRRLLTTVGAGILATAVTVAGTPAVATAAPIAPKGLTVARTTSDVHRIQMTWKPVADADHYVVDIVAGDVQTVVTVPASTTAYTIDAPDACTSFKMRVGAADAGGATSSTGYTFVKSLTPSTVMGMVTERPDGGAVAAATWREPAWTGYTPLTGYHVVFTRMADGAVLSDTTGPQTSFRFPGADPARAYTLSVTSVNGYGECWTAKSLVDRFRPAEPTGLVVQRRADAPGTVELVWRAPTYGPPPTYYQLGYGQSKITNLVRVDAAATSHTLPLDTARSWLVELKAYNANGGSNAVSGVVPAVESAPQPPPVPAPAPTTDAPTPTPPTPTATSPAPTSSATSDPAPTGSPATTTAAGPDPDRTPPTITATLSSTPSDGWFTSPVTIHFTCADVGGALASCPADIPVGTDGAAQRFSGTAVDAAGNTADASVAVSLDRVAPTITATVLGDANADGWYTTAPTVHFTCSDAVSGVAECPADRTVTADGGGQRVSGTAVDRAGHRATAAVTLDVDRGAPVISAAVLGEANADGWHRTAPTVHFTCADEVSGLLGCPADVTLDADTDAAGRGVTGTAVDVAGNTATATVVVKLDRTAPMVTAMVLGNPNAGGWHRTAPTVHFVCTDGGSGVAGCPDDVTVGTDGAAQSVTGTAVDTAGNTTTAAVTVNVDRTAPRITTAVDGTRSASGWYRGTPSVRYTCTDEGSGVATCPVTTLVAGEGAGIRVPGTVTDLAGNTSTGTVSLDIDRTAPTVSVVGATNGTVYGADAVPTVSCATTDAGSGVGTPATITHTQTFGGVHTVVCAGGIDRAGNAAAAVTVSYSVRPTTAWLSALTHQYLAGANPATVRELDAALAKRQFTLYAVRVTALSLGRKPALTSSQATTLVYWSMLL